MSLGRWSSVATGVVLVAALPLGCSSMANDKSSGSRGPCYGPSCDGGLSLDHYSEVLVGSDATQADGGPVRDPLCGPATDDGGTNCTPDEEEPKICANGRATGGAGGASNGGAGGEGGAGKLGCFVHLVDSSRVAQCEVAGSGVAGDPCLKMTDCAPGYACVGSSDNQTAGQCRHYCCLSDYQCAGDTFCAGRVLLDPDVPVGQEVPVCVAADKCPLTEAYGCDASSDCTCTDGTACTVVRADGRTTSCLPPGTGVTGEACTCATGGVCTCAPGYVCSYGTQTCKELCKTGAEPCSVGICQSSPFLPAGFGICTLAVDAGS